MRKDPETLEEARKTRYGCWAGCEDGQPYKEGYCAMLVYPAKGWITRQCQHKAHDGPEGLYCKAHAKILAKRIKL